MKMRGTKQCELCEGAARLYCESDRASLCWECDAKVHGANFLVARHPRCLLCRRCQSPTPWRADGARLGPTVSVCERCCLDGSHANGHGDVEERGAEQQRRGGDGGEEDDDDCGDEEEEEEDDEEEKEEEEEEEGENQVVPWALTPPPPPSASSSSSEEEESIRSGSSGGFLKRTRETSDLLCSYQDDPASSTSQRSRLSPEYESTSFARGDGWKEPEPFRSRVPSRPAAALNACVHGVRHAAGFVSDGRCRPPI